MVRVRLGALERIVARLPYESSNETAIVLI